MLNDLESIKNDIGKSLSEMDVHDSHRNALLDAIEKIDALMGHFVDDRR